MNIKLLDGEEFRPIGDRYFISNHGRLYYPRMDKFLKFNLNAYGYLHAAIYINGRQQTVFQHRLVAMAFIPNPENKPQINHKNCIKTDNRIDNIEWCTAKENVHHAIENDLFKIGGSNQIGSRNHNSKLTEDIVRRIKDKIATEAVSHSEIGRIFNISKQLVYRIAKGLIWQSVKID